MASKMAARFPKLELFAHQSSEMNFISLLGLTVKFDYIGYWQMAHMVQLTQRCGQMVIKTNTN